MEFGIDSNFFNIVSGLSIILILLLIKLVWKYIPVGTSSTKPIKRQTDDANDYYSNLELEDELDQEVTSRAGQRKIEKQARRRIMRENMDEENEAKAKRKDEKVKAYQEKINLREQARLQDEERMRLEKEEKEKTEHEEYLKLKTSFVIEEEGNVEVEEQNTQESLGDFISYIKEKRVVDFDVLASHFNLKVTDAIDRVKSLLEQSLLQGFIDDRGKFVYVHDDDLLKISTYINNHGRCILSDLPHVLGDLLDV